MTAPRSIEPRTSGGGSHIPTTRPERVWPVDVAAIETWNAANQRARRDYQAHPFGDCGHRTGACKR